MRIKNNAFFFRVVFFSSKNFFSIIKILKIHSSISRKCIIINQQVWFYHPSTKKQLHNTLHAFHLIHNDSLTHTMAMNDAKKVSEKSGKKRLKGELKTSKKKTKKRKMPGGDYGLFY